MYFEDLTAYCYEPDLWRIDLPSWGGIPVSCCLNVGWLDRHHDYPRAKADDQLLDILFKLCWRSYHTTRGLNECGFCPRDANGNSIIDVFAVRHGQTLRLGDSEIRVLGSDGTLYAAPTLIYHYVEAHDYLPPSQFIEAVLQSGPELKRHYRQKVAIRRLLEGIAQHCTNREDKITVQNAGFELRDNAVTECCLLLPELMALIPTCATEDLAPLLVDVRRAFAVTP